MTLNNRRWIHTALIVAAIVCSLVSLFALFGMGVVRWTTPLNVLSLLLIYLAITTRGRASSANGS
jgi:hypothetical protein